MSRGLFKVGLGLIIASGIAITGCTSAGKAPGPIPAPAQPPAQTTPAPTPDGTSPSLQDFAPTDASYKSMDGTLIHWKVTRNGDQVRVEETVGDSKVSYHYILTFSGDALVQTRFGNSNGVEFERKRTWLAVPPRAFSNEYSTEDSSVKEEATEEWTQSEEFGPMLHVHLVRSFGQNQFTVDEYYRAGLGLFSRTVKDKSGKVVDQLQLQPSK